MWLMLVVAGFLSLFVLTSVFTDYSSKQVETKSAQMATAATAPTIGNYNAFAYGATLYMRDVSGIPAAGTVVKWAAIRQAVLDKGVSAAFLDAGIPETWKIVTTGGDLFASGDGRGFYVCADMPEEAVAGVVQQISPESGLKINTALNSDSSVQFSVFTANSDNGTQAAAGASACK